MLVENNYIYKKEVDWSLLHQGLTIPISLQVHFQTLIKQTFPRGTTLPIKILINGSAFDAKLVNQNFDKQKYPNHKDIVQIRYEPNSPIAQKLRQIFTSTYEYCLEFKANDILQKYKKRPIPVPENQREFLFLYTTIQTNIFLAEYLTRNENQMLNVQISDFNEEEFELDINYSRGDLSARVEQKEQLVKIRRLDRSICDNLKQLYGNRCQITGENFCLHHGVSVVEGHHIDYFTKSFNNNSDNILIVSPNYHRLIHKLNPVFDRDNLAFYFPNGLTEKIKINLHL